MPAEWIQDQFESFDGKNIFFRFLPDPGARHTLIILHGYGEHSGRYEKFSKRLAGTAVQIAVMDLRGMGLSAGNPGPFQNFFSDISVFVAHLQEKYKVPQKFILMGHSFGGLLAAHWALKNQGCIKRLILSSPFLGFRGEGFIGAFNRLILWVLPKFVYKNPVCPKALTHDLQETVVYRQDPLIIRRISAQLVDGTLRQMELLRKQAALSYIFPVYVLLAGDERIVDAKATRLFFDRLVTPRKEWSRFEGFYHEIFNESDSSKAFNVLKTIIEDCV